MTNDNPAARLHTLLERARQISPKSSVRDGWRKLLGLPNDAPQYVLLVRLADAMRLPAQAKAAIEAIPDINVKLNLRWLPQVESAFGHMNLSATFEHFRNPITDATMVSIEHAADAIARHFGGQILTEVQLNALLAKVHELRQDVLASDATRELQELLLRHLRMMTDAIESYVVSGVEGLRAAAERAVGAVTVNQAAHGSPVADKVKRFFAGLAMALQMSANATKTIEGIDQLLLPEPAINKPASATVPPVKDGEVIDDLSRA